MHRIWLGAAAAAAFVIWLLFFQAIFVLFVLGALIAGIWICWEVFALRKAIRSSPPER